MRHATSSPLIDALPGSTCYPHPVTHVETVETHISWVVLAGDFAYKIKKPVDLGFLDFTTLEKRRHFCEEELALNRRLAPALYLDVVPITGSHAEPRIGGAGPAIEYAVKMRRFSQDAIASNLLRAGRLTPELAEALARRLARFHAQLPPAGASATYGSPESILKNALQNFAQLEFVAVTREARLELQRLRDWCEREYLLREPVMRERRRAGMIRECHGDLHLGNVALIDGELVPFDCIEFNADLRWIDVASEIAFLVMDLLDRGAERLAWLCLDSYLETSGVYSSLAVLRFYLVYRALVRAKVHLIRAQQCGEARERQRLAAASRDYVRLAQRCTLLGQPAILLMHGFSGCGKSTIARELAQALGAIWIRSDVERKRLHGMLAAARSHSAAGEALYSADSTVETYDRLAAIARVVVENGLTAVVDAAFLRRAQRAQFRRLAADLATPIAVIDVHAPRAALRERIASRAARGADASEATLQVLAYQERTAEVFADDEALTVVPFDGTEWLTRSCIEGVRRFLAQRSNPVDARQPRLLQVAQ